MQLKTAVPVLATDDVRATVDYYVRVLGFNELFVFGEPPRYAGVVRHGVEIYVKRDPRMAATLGEAGLHHDMFLWVTDVDAVYQEHKKRGAHVIEEIASDRWEARRYTVEDCNGYHIMVAEPMDEIGR